MREVELVALGVMWAVFLLLALGTYRRDRVAGLGLFFVVVALTLVPIRRVEGLPWATIMAATVLAVLLLVAARRGLWGTLDAATWALVAHLGFFVAAGLFAYPDEGRWKALVLYSLVALSSFLLGRMCSAEERRWFAGAVVTLAVAQAMYAVYELFFQPAPLLAYPTSDAMTGEPRLLYSELLPGLVSRGQGTLGHPLPLSLLLLVALALVLNAGVVQRRLARVAVYVVLVGGLVSTGSRAAMIVALGLVLFSRRGSDRFAVGAVGLVAVGVFAFLLGAANWGVVQRLLGSGSLDHRVAVFGAIGRILEQPAHLVVFGNGFASTDRLFRRGLLQRDGFEVVDNQVVLLLAEGGLVVLALTGLWIWLCLRGARSWLVFAVAPVVVMLAVFDLLAWPSSVALSAGLLGLARGSGRLAQDERADGVVGAEGVGGVGRHPVDADKGRASGSRHR